MAVYNKRVFFYEFVWQLYSALPICSIGFDYQTLIVSVRLPFNDRVEIFRGGQEQRSDQIQEEKFILKENFRCRGNS